MHTFHCPELKSGKNFLSEDESHHCARVLRLKEGNEVRLIDGGGTVARVKLTEVGSKKVHFSIIDEQSFPPPKKELIVAIAPTKSIDRFEFFIEKAVELGVNRIIPILCERSERKNLRHDRMLKNVLSATKQSMRAYLPQIDQLTPFKDLKGIFQSKEIYIAHCEKAEKASISNISLNDALVMIGPEGDFSKAEIDCATEWGAKGLDLGINRLRTETAGIFVVAAASLQYNLAH